MPKINSKASAKDVAREAGVSQSTVSFVLSRSKHADRISLQTRQKVLSVAQRLGYNPNSAGTALRRGYSNTIVVMVVTWELANGHAHTAMSVSRAASARGLTTIVHVAADDREATSFLDGIWSLNPYGLVLLWDSPAKSAECLKALFDENLPVIDLMPSVDKCIAGVTADRKQGARLAAEHLLELGHRHIGIILNTRSRMHTSLDKLAGYKEALNNYGIDFHESLVQEASGFDFDAGHYAMRGLMRQRPDMTAVMCINDAVAIGAMAAAQDSGLCIPDDMSVVGFGSFQEGTYVRPPLTTLAIPSNRIAEDAVNLMQKMRQEENYESEPERVPMELIVRKSTGPARP